MANTEFKINSLKELNSKLVAEIAELRKENAEIKAENIKLKQAMKGVSFPLGLRSLLQDENWLTQRRSGIAEISNPIT